MATITLCTTFVGVNSSLRISRSTNTFTAQATTINAEDQGMTGDSTTVNNKALQNLLDKWKSDNLTINIPKGTYLFDAGNIKLHSNITFNFDNGAVFQAKPGDNQVNFVYPSPKAGYDGGINNVKWEGASFKGDNTSSGQSVFVQSIHHATNITFNSCTFDNAESPGGHYIDLDGSHDINIMNSRFIGFNAAPGLDYKEAIQIDYSNPNAMSARNPGDQYDNLPTYNVKVDNNKFLPIYSKTGKITSYAPNPIGEHTIYNDGKAGIIHDIYFTNNTVTDPKPLLESYDATIRFIDVSNLWIENNKFTNKQILRSGNYIYLNNLITNYKMKNLNIKGNTFTNINPNKQYIFLNNINPKNPMSKINITGNKIVNQQSDVAFVSGNFPLSSTTIKISNNKSTGQPEKYYSGVSSQHAQLAKGHQNYSLYNHIRGHKNWKIQNFDWKKNKIARVYIDKRATAGTGEWYRIRFNKDNSARKYWIRKGALKFDTFKTEIYNKYKVLKKDYPVYTRPYNDPLLAEQKGTTSSFIGNTVAITHLTNRTKSNGQISLYFQMSNGLWVQSSAFK